MKDDERCRVQDVTSLIRNWESKYDTTSTRHPADFIPDATESLTERKLVDEESKHPC